MLSQPAPKGSCRGRIESVVGPCKHLHPVQTANQAEFAAQARMPLEQELELLPAALIATHEPGAKDRDALCIALRQHLECTGRPPLSACRPGTALG